MSILDNLNAPEIEGLFEDGTIDGLDIVNIPIEDISKNANDKAQSLVEDLTEFYYDPEFLKNNPNFKKRVDNDLESLRMLLKMREADEVTHDVIIKAIAANSSNASLYRSLTQIQTTILQITTKIETIVNNLTTMIKSYQLELNFKMEQEQLKNESEEPTSVEDISSAHRGSKSFIEQMNKIEEQSLLKTEEDNN
jgi:hypothetical protein